MRTAGYTYDQNGNMLTGGTRDYAWNIENQPTVINNWPVNEQYRYDATGGRVRRVVNGGTSPGTTYYVGGLYEESVPNGGGPATTRFMYSLNGQVVAQREIAPDPATPTPTLSPTNTPTRTATPTRTPTPVPGGCQAVTWSSAVNVTVSGNSIEKTSGVSGSWDAGAVSKSTQSIASGNGYVQMTASSDLRSVAFGLSSEGTAGSGNGSQSYEDIDYAIRLEAGGTVSVYEAGVYKGDFGTFRSGNVFRVEVAASGGPSGGVQIKYSKNGSVFYTTTLPGIVGVYPLQIDTSLYDIPNDVNNAWICSVIGGSSPGTGGNAGASNNKAGPTRGLTPTATASKAATKTGSAGKPQGPTSPNVVNTLIYLHSDHLGSVSVATNSSGGVVSSQEFDPWGKVRDPNTQVTQTKRNYTGQKLDGTALLYYGARYYDPSLARFVSPDSIVPGAASGVGGAGGTVGAEQNSTLTVDFHESEFLSSAKGENATILQKGFWFQLSGRDRQKAKVPWGPANTQALNRYAYALNNPLRYTDPTGHYVSGGDHNMGYSTVCENSGGYQVACGSSGSKEVKRSDGKAYLMMVWAPNDSGGWDRKYVWSDDPQFQDFKQWIDQSDSTWKSLEGIGIGTILPLIAGFLLAPPTGGISIGVAIVVSGAMGWYGYVLFSLWYDQRQHAYNNFKDIENYPYKPKYNRKFFPYGSYECDTGSC